MKHWLETLVMLGSSENHGKSDGERSALFSPAAPEPGLTRGFPPAAPEPGLTSGFPPAAPEPCLTTVCSNKDCVLVSVIDTKGSSPRNSATRMIVTGLDSIGTIGGGHLEYKAISIAKQMLAEKIPGALVKRFPLGASLGQCCGGVVYLSFEYIAARQPDWVSCLDDKVRTGVPVVLVSQLPAMSDTQTVRADHAHLAIQKLVVSLPNCTSGTLADPELEAIAKPAALAMLRNSAQHQTLQHDNLFMELLRPVDFRVAVFGAGHVGKALINILASLPCQVYWIDSRVSEFPAVIPQNVYRICIDHPEEAVEELPANCQVVIMTHSHALDQLICERVLRSARFAFCGLIGSLSKRRQFERRLLARGLPVERIRALTCPIGVPGISGKQPAEIAVAISAQLLQIHSVSNSTPADCSRTTSSEHDELSGLLS